jgi:nucleoside-diphosphate-sugar epimerase
LNWLKAGISLIQEFSGVNGQRLVIAGTCAEYAWKFGYCSEQITPLAPDTLYGVCKDALNRALESFSSRQALSSAWGRIFSLYGPDEHPSRLACDQQFGDGKPAKITTGTDQRLFVCRRCSVRIC